MRTMVLIDGCDRAGRGFPGSDVVLTSLTDNGTDDDDGTNVGMIRPRPSHVPLTDKRLMMMTVLTNGGLHSRSGVPRC
jgi:hypothetical protein